MHRIPSQRLLASALALALACSVVFAAPAPRRARAVRPPAEASSPATPAPIELVESVPIETSLGNPKLRHPAEVWVELIRSATARIDLEQFYLTTWPDEPLEPVLKALVEAAKRGVSVRLLIDARMHKTYPQPVDSLGLVPGITVRAIDMGKVSGGVQHAKYFIVDGRTVFLGSQNFDWRALDHIHELGVSIRDERVAERFQQVFDMDWAAAGLQATGADTSSIVAWPAPSAVAGGLPIRVVQSPGDTAEVWPSWSPRAFSPDSMLWDRDAIVREIDGARREVVVQTMHFATRDRGLVDDAFDQALRRAASRGVSVKLIISDWSAGTEAMKTLDSLAAVPGIEVRLSIVPDWSKGYIAYARLDHSKYMVVDTLSAWVGTSNWEPSYFHSTRNVAVVLRDRPLARAAREVFRANWDAMAGHPVRAGIDYPRREHGADPPAGLIRYGN